jgi:hypothetical protein
MPAPDVLCRIYCICNIFHVRLIVKNSPLVDMEFQPPHVVNIEKDKRLPFRDIIDIIRAEIQGHRSPPSSKCYTSITNPITECNLDFMDFHQCWIISMEGITSLSILHNFDFTGGEIGGDSLIL